MQRNDFLVHLPNYIRNIASIHGREGFKYNPMARVDFSQVRFCINHKIVKN